MVYTVSSSPACYKGINAAAVAAGASNGTAVPVAGYKSLVCICVTDNAATGTTTFKLQHSVDGSTNWNDITGATTAAIATGDDNEAFPLVLADLHNVRNYVRAVATVATDTAVAVSASFILFGGRDDDSGGTNAAVVV